MNALGFVFPAAAVGSGALLVKPQRGIYPGPGPGGPVQPLIATVTVEEHHRDELTITEHPVEQGAPIADHAYKQPAEVTLRLAWSMAPPTPGGSGMIVSQAVSVAATLLGQPASIAAAAVPTYSAVQSLLTGSAPNQIKAVYDQLLALQASRVPFTVLTGKRRYINMLLASIGVVTDKTTENALAVVVRCREVIIVSTSTVSAVPADASQQKSPEITAPPINAGALSLQPSSTYTPGGDTLAGATDALQAGVVQTQAMLGGVQGAIGTLAPQVQSAVNSLTFTLANLGPAMDQVAATIQPAMEVPLTASAETLTVPIASGPSAALSAAIASAAAPLAQAQTILTSSMATLTGAASTLPAALEGLPAMVAQMRAQAELVAAQFSRVTQ